MALSTNSWLSVIGGPGVGKLLLTVFGDSEDDQQDDPWLTFTVGDAVDGKKHALRIAFQGIGFQHPSLDFSRKVYEITGLLEEVDGKRRKLPSIPPLVTITHYKPAHPRKGDAGLKIDEIVWYDNLEAMYSVS